MGIQTTVKDYVYIPDSAKVELSTDLSSWSDIGVVQGDITNVYQYEMNEVQSANGGALFRSIKNMRIEGNFVLMNLNLDNITTLSGGIFTKIVTTATPITTSPDQVIASGATELKPINLAPLTSSSDSTPLKASAVPTLTSVIGSVDGALVANDDYTIIEDDNSYSGYSIIFNTAGAILTTMAQTFTIDYASVTPVSNTTITAGESVQKLTARGLRFTHTDENGLARALTLYAVDIDPGGFQFNFKSALAENTEEMPIAYTARLDTSRSNGDQLFNFSVDEGAQ